MTREELTQILDDAKTANQDEDFVIEINPSDMRSVLARLRHMEAKGVILEYNKIDFKRIEVFGYDA